MKKNIFGLIIVFLLFSTFNPKISFLENLNFKPHVKNIKILNNSIVKARDIREKLDFLYSKNLLFIKNKDIEKKLIDENFIESFALKRIYPDTLIIKIFEKKPIAILQNKKKKFIISNKGDLLTFRKLEKNEKLPMVFGEGKSFYNFYRNIKNSNFPVEEVQAFYFFESKRWDILLYDGKLIKLPIKNYIYSLKNLMNLKKNNIHKKYKVFDYRITNQLILN